MRTKSWVSLFDFFLKDNLKYMFAFVVSLELEVKRFCRFPFILQARHAWLGEEEKILANFLARAILRLFMQPLKDRIEYTPTFACNMKLPSAELLSG